MRFSIFFFLPFIYSQPCHTSWQAKPLLKYRDFPSENRYPSINKPISDTIPPCTDSKPLVIYHPYLRSPYPDFQKYEKNLRLMKKKEEEEEIEMEWIDT
jgi:hypothetical protein